MIGIPVIALENCIIHAGREFKADKRRTMKEILKATIFVRPDYAIVNDGVKEPDFIHEAQVVNPNTKGRNIRYRPAFKEGWTARFQIDIDDPEVVPAERLKEILEFAGRRVGVGDWRPRYGRFLVAEFKF